MSKVCEVCGWHVYKLKNDCCVPEEVPVGVVKDSVAIAAKKKTTPKKKGAKKA